MSLPALLPALALALASAPAQAGSGPWVLGRGDESLYLGVEGQRFDTLALSPSSTHADSLPVGAGVQTFSMKAIATVGLLPRLEGELGVPWEMVRQNDEGAYPCPDLSLGACRPSTGIGVIRARVKGLVLDEIVGSPVSLAVGAELRMGQFTSSTRERITNLGEGTMDLGGFLSVGHTGSLGKGFWSAYLEGGERYRSPNRSLADRLVPSAETWGEVEWLLAPVRPFSFGPAGTWLWRPGGIDIQDMLADPTIVLNQDRFAALRVMSLQVGGKALVRTSDMVTTSLGVLRTVYAFNNPEDTWTIDLGVGVRGFIRRRDRSGG